MHTWTALLFLLAFGAHGVRSADSPEILPVDAAGLNRILESARGNVVLVNFWATWCAPCVEEFPDLLRLKEQYGPKGLKVLFVSIDRPAEAGTTLARFLRGHGVTFTTYVKKAGNDESFINAMDKGWSGALPATFIYDRQGKKVHFLLEAQSYQSLVQHIQPLLVH